MIIRLKILKNFAKELQEEGGGGRERGGGGKKLNMSHPLWGTTAVAADSFGWGQGTLLIASKKRSR